MKQAVPQTESALKINDIKGDHEDISLRKDKPPVPYYKMFRFADTKDKVLMITGVLAAIAVGISMPAFTLLWGQMTDTFQTSESDPDAMVRESKKIMFNLIYIGIGVFVCGWAMAASWIISGQRQAIRCRKQYLAALLRQQIGWFDQIDQTQLASKFATETFGYHGAIGQKVSTFVKIVATLIAGFVVAYIKGWKMALVVTAGIPAIGFSGFLYMLILQAKDKKTSSMYNQAGGKAQQVIGSIRTVKSLNGQVYQSGNFHAKLSEAVSKSFKYIMYAGLGMGLVFFAMLSCNALGFWYGSKLVNEKTMNMGSPYSAGDVLVVFFSIVIGGSQMSQLGPCLKKFAEGQMAAANIFAVIDREPKIINNPQGKTIDNLIGIIKFQNVVFAYPKQPERMILNGISFQIKPNMTTAFVGESGCGKSTILQLIMRFYDPLQGRITIDGVDIRELKLQWIRQKIGYVGQQPVLFATSIRENLLLGSPKATEQQIIEALKKAEAYNFVMDLDGKLDTYVGYGGGQLSGGQKQRIAIARAILKNPRILILDEATSALDRKNQKLIQKTLNKISTGRTTVSIAHRTKTIMTADNIVVVAKGQVKESGKFMQLERFKAFHGELQNDPEEQKQEEQEPVVQQQQTKVIVPKVQETKKEVTNKGKPVKPKLTEKEIEEQQYKKQLKKKYESQAFKRLIYYTLPDIKYFIIGVIAAAGNGVTLPIFSIFLARMMGILIDMQLGQNKQSQANQVALIYLGLAIAGFFSNFLQNSMFGIVADRLTLRVRSQVFSKMIVMPIRWFDEPKNNAGTLTARLSVDCKTINGVTSVFIGVLVQNLSCILCGIIIAFIYEWRITLVTLALLPIMVASGYIKMKALVGFSEETGEAYKDSSNLIMEAMLNIRTVASFGVQNTFAAKYDLMLQKPYYLAIKSGNLSGFLYGISQFIMFIIFGLVFYIGTIFTRDQHLDFVNVFTAIYAIIFAASTVGKNSQMMPDLAQCNTSAAYLFSILDSEDQGQLQVKTKSKMITQGGLNGLFEIKNIGFKYPARRFKTFTNLSFKIEAGNKVAFVGPSGCGKSTIIQMLLRFYDPDEGQILLDGVNLKDYDIHYLRGLLGLVSQEPVLFNASFAENIKYNKTDATMEDIRMAATKANALTFIETADTQGFNRSVGVKGGQISGGQKQRVAIARAILRNPKILLLDEATSALDSQNQKLVQDSLDSIMNGRTSVSIAHRIDTIKNSDCIFVFSVGQIVEQGTYAQLIEKKGYFYQLQQGTTQ